MTEDRDRKAAIERAKKMKALVPDATVRGFGRVRDLTEDQLAAWILRDRQDSREVAR